MTVPLDDSQDPMPPDTVSNPVVTSVKPVSDDNMSQESSKEAHSESADESSVLSRVNSESGVQRLSRENSTGEHASSDYDDGFSCGLNGGPNDETKSEPWQRGWAEAQE